MNTNFSKQMAILGAAAATFVAGCSKQEDLNTSFKEAPVIVAPIPLVHQDRIYHAGDSIIVVNGTEQLEISAKSVQPEGRVIANLLDYMTEHLAFEAKLSFTAVEGCGNELPAESLTLEIAPPSKEFFKGINQEYITFNDSNSQELVCSLVAGFVRLVRGPDVDSMSYVVPGNDLNPGTQKLLAEMRKMYESKDFSLVTKYDEFVNRVTDDYARTFRSKYNIERDDRHGVFFEEFASRDACSNIDINELKLMRDKAPVNYNFDLLKEVYDIIANPKKAARTLPASSTGDPSVTSIQ